MTGSGVAVAALSGVPSGLREPLLAAFNKLARHYREGRWEPAELNGGKLCEIVYTIVKGHVDGTFPLAPSKPPNMFDACCTLAQAASFPRSVRIQIPRILMALYEIRNNRNVGHVGADVDPNHMDAALVLSMAKWVMAELVRIFHNISTEEATEVIENLTERMIPILWSVGGITRVLGKLNAKQKTLVLIYGATTPLQVSDIVNSIGYSNPSQFRNTVLKSLHKGDLLHFDVERQTVVISPLGVRHLEQNIPLEL